MSHGGFSFGKNRPSGGMYRSGDQLNLANATWTTVQLNAIRSSFADAIEDTGAYKITPGVAGLYDIVGHVFFDSVVADKIYGARIYLNGSDSIKTRYLHASLADWLCVQVSIQAWLTATDYVQLQAYQASGLATVDILGGYVNTTLTVQRVR